jgi:hypothetical protein
MTSNRRQTRLRIVALSAIALSVMACGSPTSPSERTLQFTFSPNPAPTMGVVFVPCTGQVAPAKTWLYTLRIENRSSTPFVIQSGSYTLRAAGSSTTFTQDFDQALAAAAFGSATIPPGGAVSGGLCTFLAAPSGTVSYALRGTDGSGPYSSQELQLLP